MPTVTFIHPSGRTESLDAAIGVTVMQVATSNGIAGIVAEYGGGQICGTCHVYGEPTDIERFGAMGEDEDLLLDGTASDRLPNSRLSCQMWLNEATGGVTVRLPDRQI